MSADAALEATSVSAAKRPVGRSFLPDLLKAAGCLLIVLHHMAFYGPMADVVARAWPAGMGWLAQHARLAVQVFLVCSGFLTAQSLAALPALSWPVVAQAVSRRYLRLAIPLLAALSLTVLVSELIRPSFVHGSLSDPPDWLQALAHLFFLQHVLNQEALSAGIWYVAVDMQLFVLALLLLWLSQITQSRLGGSPLGWQALLTLALLAMSLMEWTHDDGLDDTALYFWGSYAMGWLAWHGRRLFSPAWRWGLLLALGALCLFVDVRFRALTAWASAALLMAAPAAWLASQTVQDQVKERPVRRTVSWLSRISYAVFVVHFGVCLLVNFVVHALWPDTLVMNALGMVAAVGLSLLAGQWLHRWTECGAVNWTRWMAMAGAFMASTGLAIWLAA